MLKNNDVVHEVRGLTAEHETQIAAFMQGAVYCWVKNRFAEPFALRDLFGGENTIWTDTPLQVLYSRQAALGKTPAEAHEQAAKDAGWLLKKMLRDDQRTFTCQKDGLVNHYVWVP